MWMQHLDSTCIGRSPSPFALLTEQFV